MNNYSMDFTVLEQFSTALAFGFLTTVAMSVLSITAGTALAFPWFVQWLAKEGY